MAGESARFLNLDRGMLRVAADAYEGLARVYAEQRGAASDAGLLEASCLVIAASSAALLDVRESKDLFRRAAESYMAMANMGGESQRRRRMDGAELDHGKGSFAILLAICGMDVQLTVTLLEAIDRRKTHFSSPDTLAALLVARAMLTFSGVRLEGRHELPWLMEEARSMSAYEVGRLGIPLSHYVNLARLSRRDLGFEEESKFVSLVFARVGDFVEGAVGTKDWSRLQSQVLPFEPELLVICLIADAWFREKGPKKRITQRLPWIAAESAMAGYVEVAARFWAEPDNRQRGAEMRM